MKINLLSGLLLFPFFINAQVGIKTSNPQAILDIKGTNYNPLGTTADNGKGTLRIDGETSHAIDMGTLANSPWGGYIQAKD